MSNSNVNVEACAESSPAPRPSNVRQLIQMFEQLTIYGVQSAPPPVLRGEAVAAELPDPRPTTYKTLTLLVNGRRVAQTMQRDTAELAKGLDAGSW